MTLYDNMEVRFNKKTSLIKDCKGHWLLSGVKTWNRFYFDIDKQKYPHEKFYEIPIDRYFRENDTIIFFDLIASTQRGWCFFRKY